MRFALLVQADPAQCPSAISALRFAEAVAASAHTLVGVFFQGDGVQVAQQFRRPPRDEGDLKARWEKVSENCALPLQLCVASALRRGLVDGPEAARAGLAAATLAPPFELAGLATFLAQMQTADRVLTFGAAS